MTYSSRIRVVFLVSTLRRSGPTSQLLNIVRNLEPSQFTPIVVTLSQEPRDSMQDVFLSCGLTVTSFNLSRLSGLTTQKWDERLEAVCGWGAQPGVVVHSQGVRADRISAFHLGGYSRLATARNCPTVDYRMKYGTLVGALAARAHLSALKALPLVIACSRALQSELARCGLKTHLVRNAVDTDRFCRVSDVRRQELRELLGLEAGVRVGISVGELSKRKNPELIAKAITKVNDDKLRLLFIGDGPLEAACRQLVGRDPRVRFVGRVDDVVPYLQCADFLVSSSMAEGFPNAALEALACGCRLILSDIAPHLELLDELPASGGSFSLSNPSELEELLQLPAREMRSPSSSEISLKIGAPRMAEEYGRWYAELARA